MERFGPCTFPFEQIEAFLRHHGLQVGAMTPVHGQAVVNWVFLAKEYVLRISKPDIETDDAYTEQVAVPAVRAAGIDTPELLVFDDSRAILDTVVTVYRRAPGVALGRIRVNQRELPEVYRRLGAEVWRIQEQVRAVPDPDDKLDPFELGDPRAAMAKMREERRVELVTYDWFQPWLERLETVVYEPQPKVFAHQDLHAFNTLVFQDPLRFDCVIDWGDAGWCPPYEDFCAVPLWAVPWMIEGYEKAGGHFGDQMFACVLWSGLSSLFEWRDHEGDEPWAPMSSSLWANLVRLMRCELRPGFAQWLPAP